MPKKLRINWKAVTAALVGLAGVAAHPAVSSVLPPRASAILAALAVAVQAVTNAVTAAE